MIRNEAVTLGEALWRRPPDRGPYAATNQLRRVASAPRTSPRGEHDARAVRGRRRGRGRLSGLPFATPGERAKAVEAGGATGGRGVRRTARESRARPDHPVVHVSHADALAFCAGRAPRCPTSRVGGGVGRAASASATRGATSGTWRRANAFRGTTSRTARRAPSRSTPTSRTRSACTTSSATSGSGRPSGRCAAAPTSATPPTATATSSPGGPTARPRWATSASASFLKAA